MISKSLKEMIKGRWREFKREPSAMFFVVLMPLLWMVVLGLAFSGDNKDKFGVGMLDTEMASPKNIYIRDLLTKDETIRLRVGSEVEQDRWLKRGEIVLVVKPDMDQMKVLYQFDPTNPQSTRARQVVNDHIQSNFGRTDPIEWTNKPLVLRGSRYIDFLVPGLLAMSILTSSLFGTGMTIVVNRRENLLKRYRTTPMSPYEYIVSHIIARYFILTVEFATVMISAALLFGFRVEGSWFDYTVFAGLGAAAATAIGIFLGARTANSAAYNGMTNLITWPMTMFSGIWFSRSGFPDWLADIVKYLPLTAMVDGFRKISLEGQGLTELIPEISILSVYLVCFTVAAKVRFRWY
jgi:ABC-type multidrug transport system permease subunit